jgi:hypothetical protein
VIVSDPVRVLARHFLTEWRALSLGPLEFAHRNEAELTMVALLALSLVLLAGRTVIGRRPWRYHVVLPAVLGSIANPLGAHLIHVPLLIFIAGLPFLALALADPHTALVHREASYPGRRICLTIDASNSMSSPFSTDTLRTQSKTGAAFFSTVAAAERFVQLRINGPYRDLLALVEFGSEAYVITPFTHDYDNILLSLSLIGAPTEFNMFPDPRTLIARAIERSVALFKAFEFLDASGNLLVIFSDGEDATAAAGGRSLDDIMRGAMSAAVPVYFVRVNDKLNAGDFIPDALWTEAVERTGGKFFAASDEPTLLAAIEEIDRATAGTITVSEYSAHEPRFVVFAALAATCFLLAIALKLTVPYFRRFP